MLQRIKTCHWLSCKVTTRWVWLINSLQSATTFILQTIFGHNPCLMQVTIQQQIPHTWLADERCIITRQSSLLATRNLVGVPLCSGGFGQVNFVSSINLYFHPSTEYVECLDLSTCLCTAKFNTLLIFLLYSLQMFECCSCPFMTSVCGYIHKYKIIIKTNQSANATMNP